MSMTTGTAAHLAEQLNIRSMTQFYDWVRRKRIVRIGLTPPGAGRCVIVYEVRDPELIARLRAGGKDRP